MSSTHSAVEAHLDAVIDAAGKLLSPEKSYDFGGRSLTRDQLVQLFASHVAPYKGITDARLQVTQLEKTREGARAEVKNDLELMKVLLTALFGRGAPELIKAGYKPAKTPTPLTPEQKVARAAKALATRALRGTKGSRQKAALKATGPFDVNVSPPPTTSTGSKPATTTNGTPGTPGATVNGGSK